MFTKNNLIERIHLLKHDDHTTSYSIHKKTRQHHDRDFSCHDHPALDRVSTSTVSRQQLGSQLHAPIRWGNDRLIDDRVDVLLAVPRRAPKMG